MKRLSTVPEKLDPLGRAGQATEWAAFGRKRNGRTVGDPFGETGHLDCASQSAASNLARGSRHERSRKARRCGTPRPGLFVAP